MALIKRKRFPVKEIILVGLLPSPLKKMVYRMRGYSIGKGVHFGIGSVILGNQVKIGDGTSFGFLSVVKGRSIEIGRFVKIGATSIIDTEAVFIDDDARINEQVFIGGTRTPQSSIRVGKRAIIMQMSFINPTLPIEIGDDSGVGGHCLIFTHGSWSSELEGYPVKFAPVKIGKKVWLPWRVFILPGVEIGDQVVLGAGAVVNKSIPANSLAVGSPAKVIKENFPNKIDHDAQLGIIQRVLKEFHDHLAYYDFTIETADTTTAQVAHYMSPKTKATLCYTEEEAPEKPLHRDNSVWMTWATPNDETARQSGYGMIVYLGTSERWGQSDVGEELVAFISRYGIRFDRLD